MTWLFEKIHATSKSIFENLLDLETKAKQAIESVDDRPLQNPILEIEERIESKCDDLTQCIFKLTKLQSSVRMALAIHGKGPEADLYEMIKNVRETLLRDDNDSATTDDSASHTSSDEKCSECQSWFPAYALPLHEEGCKGVPKRQHRSTKATGVENKAMNFASTAKDDLQVPAEPSAEATAEAQTRTPPAKGVESYGVWRAKPVRYTYEDRHEDPVSPHLSLHFADDEAGEGRAAINVKSGDRQESRLVYWMLPHFTHPITYKLAALNDDFQLLADTSEQGPGGLALDFIRGNLFRRSDGRILGHDVEGPDNDILDQLKPILDRAISAEATVYIYGSHFSDGKGIHNVHMNQGNSRRWEGDNGVFQDGALIFEFEDHWEAVFIAFASQAVHTNDAGQSLPRTGYMTWARFVAPRRTGEDRDGDNLADSPVFITQALINLQGPDRQPGTAPEAVTLTNRTSQELNLSGWKIRNKTGEAQEVPSGQHIAANGTMTVEMPHAPLSNQGGTITLLNAQGLKVHGVSYTEAQAQGGMVTFARPPGNLLTAGVRAAPKRKEAFKFNALCSQKSWGLVWGEDYSIILWGSSRQLRLRKKRGPTTFNPGVQINIHQVKSLSKGISGTTHIVTSVGVLCKEAIRTARVEAVHHHACIMLLLGKRWVRGMK
ncbi:hypothetical protein FOXB_04604 [Fusarium oxysporum f. sp. conglutinans Fo5176]|uniref:LTD domain-containing protein n=1 Tax=Fusarium oxysporum (strain Fo5176) TaxID=660025 RepID=F9FDX6_FUSOF|nr:hypothetical protein FOXB_04604 [Fusarium oxysporum f. sp. conglutinans Fo5176]